MPSNFESAFFSKSIFHQKYLSGIQTHIYHRDNSCFYSMQQNIDKKKKWVIEIIFLFLNQGICCGYSKYVLMTVKEDHT